MTQLLTYIVSLSTAAALYCIGLVLYRLFFHPLASFPGPKLAAVTLWYERYFDIFKSPGGTYMHEIDRIHEKYGPIVRVNPHELHIKDSEYYDVLFCSPSQGIRNKYITTRNMSGGPLGLHSTLDHEQHRKRRAAINPLFSKKSVLAAEPMVQDMVNKLCAYFLSASSEGKVIDLKSAFGALAEDVVQEYSLKANMGYLDDEQRALEWRETFDGIIGATSIGKQFGWVRPLMMSLPLGVLRWLSPPAARLMEFQNKLHKQAVAAISEFSNHNTHEKKAKLDKRQHENPLFKAILAASHLPDDDKMPMRIRDEALTVVGAGGDTTARVLSYMTFFMGLHKDTILPKLRKELESVMADPNMGLDWKTAEQLPYLTAVIKESLRITTTIVSRLPLLSPIPITYKSYTIPPNTPISMSPRDVLLDPSIFPSPLTFDPSRWLPSNPDLPRLNRFFVPFSRGSRMCIGLNLAYAELYLAAGCVFRRFDVEVWDTEWERDLEVVSDFFVGEPRKGSRGIRAKMRAVEGYQGIRS
ncbi:cytochrome P450 [Delitschia confertaspora ATCC 74209]|uniref:Cytochrome P450 n=1 Tax=Delitschia confertaspora ATCC 74209 TaxID=1513339 RepID=A0A9P4JQX1_9PLEO|nr:cytochrome P450 [Delitschia confertaspora ATCC 74209]